MSAQSATGSYTVYVMRCSDGSLYTGIAADLSLRIKEHNAGRGSRYTRSRLPVHLAYQERAGSRSEALKRELQIKRLSRKAKLLLCSSYLAKVSRG